MRKKCRINQTDTKNVSEDLSPSKDATFAALEPASVHDKNAQNIAKKFLKNF